MDGFFCRFCWSLLVPHKTTRCSNTTRQPGEVTKKVGSGYYCTTICFYQFPCHLFLYQDPRTFTYQRGAVVLAKNKALTLHCKLQTHTHTMSTCTQHGTRKKESREMVVWLELNGTWRTLYLLCSEGGIYETGTRVFWIPWKYIASITLMES